MVRRKGTSKADSIRACPEQGEGAYPDLEALNTVRLAEGGFISISNVSGSNMSGSDTCLVLGSEARLKPERAAGGFQTRPCCRRDPLPSRARAHSRRATLATAKFRCLLLRLFTLSL